MNPMGYLYGTLSGGETVTQYPAADLKPCSHRYGCTLDGQHTDLTFAVSQHCHNCGSLVRSQFGTCACGYKRKASNVKE